MRQLRSTLVVLAGGPLTLTLPGASEANATQRADVLIVDGYTTTVK
jgi:hypothetical protein